MSIKEDLGHDYLGKGIGSARLSRSGGGPSICWPVEVGEGEKVVLNPGRVSGKGLDINGLVIYSAAGGEAGRISATSSTLPLPPVTMRLKRLGGVSRLLSKKVTFWSCNRPPVFSQ